MEQELDLRELQQFMKDELSTEWDFVVSVKDYIFPRKKLFAGSNNLQWMVTFAKDLHKAGGEEVRLFLKGNEHIVSGNGVAKLTKKKSSAVAASE